MALKAYNVGGGRHSEAALSALLSQLFNGDVAKGFNIEATGSAGLNVRVLPGTAQIRVNTLYSRMIQNDANITTTAVAAPTSNPRRNLVVAYIDSSVTPTTAVVDNINGVVKIAVVLGAEAATPQIPTDFAVTAAVGTQNWIPLGDFRTNVSQTSVVAGNITDQRRMILVTSDKIDWATLSNSTTQWRTWTPTLVNFTGSVNVARYTLVGKTCHFYIRVTQGNSVTGAHTFSLPIPAVSSQGASTDFGQAPKIGQGHILDFGSQAFKATGTLYSTTQIRLMVEAISGSYVAIAETSPTVPMAWVNGQDSFYLLGSYETE